MKYCGIFVVFITFTSFSAAMMRSIGVTHRELEELRAENANLKRDLLESELRNNPSIIAFLERLAWVLDEIRTAEAELERLEKAIETAKNSLHVVSVDR